MTDLQNALKRWDSERSENVIRRINSTSDDVELFVAAARLVANPNIEAAADAILTYWLSGTTDPALAEWWITDEAAQAAGDLANLATAAAFTSLGDE